MTASDRRSFARSLGEGLSSPEPVRRVNELLRNAMVSDSTEWEVDDQRLVRAVAQRLDAVNGDTERFVGFARDIELLLDRASSNDSVELLLELMAERQRLAEIVRKYAAGHLSRTSFMSFVTEQRWPGQLRQRVGALSPDDLTKLVDALEQSDIARLEAALID